MLLKCRNFTILLAEVDLVCSNNVGDLQLVHLNDDAAIVHAKVETVPNVDSESRSEIVTKQLARLDRYRGSLNVPDLSERQPERYLK